MSSATRYHRLIGLGSVFCVSLLLAGEGAAQTFFTNVTDEAIRGPLIISSSTTWGDYDNDGRPDLFSAERVTLPLTRLVLLHNDGDGRFTDRSAAIQGEITPKYKGGGSIFGDYDNDGDLDLFVPVGS